MVFYENPERASGGERTLEWVQTHVQETRRYEALQQPARWGWPYGYRNQKGIPIGNLTSQIFANIYLDEFDRFVRHQLKPHAYLRYGDDFFLIAQNRLQAERFRQYGTDFLRQQLKLTLHVKNNVVVPVRQGVHYLGVEHYRRGTSLPQKSIQAVWRNLSAPNQTSYVSYVERYGSRRQQLVMDGVVQAMQDNSGWSCDEAPS